MQAEIVLQVPDDARLACVGMTGTGKSTLARALFVSASKRRRVVVDPFDSPISDGDWPTITEPRGIDFGRSRTYRVVPRDPRDLDFYDKLYQRLFEEKNLLIWSDEMSVITTSHQLPLGVSQVQLQGRKRRISHIACSQRPVGVHPQIWANSEKWAIFRLPSFRDRETIASNAGIPIRQFDALHAGLGRHGFIWWDVHKQQLVQIPKGLKLSKPVEHARGPRGELDQSRRS